jgi:hypothetical protein
MISDRKCRANSANSRLSTGPKTAVGRSTAAQNARRHGLAIPVWSDPALSAEIEAMAREIAAGATSPELMGLARRVAEAEIDVLRVRRVRAAMMAKLQERPGSTPREFEAASQTSSDGRCEISMRPNCFGDELIAIDRYERRALSRRKFAIRAFDKASATGVI